MRSIEEIEVAMKTSELLIGAKSLIEAGWCQGVMAANDLDVVVHSNAKDATKFCALGAMQKVVCEAQKVVCEARISPYDISTPPRMIDYLARSIDKRTIPAWNDDPARTQQEVIDAFDAAIKLAVEVGD